MEENGKPLVSIALASYNGIKYIKDQINSILDSEYQNIEIIISDDGSTDGTYEVIQQIIKNLPSKKLILVRNNSKGFVSNFSNAIEHCRGDFIFLCDQDDIWYKKKISKHLEIYKLKSSVDVICNDVLFFDDKKSNNTLTKLKQFKKYKLSYDKFVMGCAHSFRRSYIDKLMPIPSQVISHDDYLIYPSIFYSNRVILEDTLQDYRIHENNTSKFFINYSWKYSKAIVLFLRIYFKLTNLNKQGDLRLKVKLLRELSIKNYNNA